MSWGGEQRGSRGLTLPWSSRTCSCSQCARRRCAPAPTTRNPGLVPSCPVFFGSPGHLPAARLTKEHGCVWAASACSMCTRGALLPRSPGSQAVLTCPHLRATHTLPPQDATHFRRGKDAAGKDILEPCSPGEPGAFAATLQVRLPACLLAYPCKLCLVLCPSSLPAS